MLVLLTELRAIDVTADREVLMLSDGDESECFTDVILFVTHYLTDDVSDTSEPVNILAEVTSYVSLEISLRL